ncbi:hypothetical protein D3C87_1269220 [compost metagenome]
MAEAHHSLEVARGGGRLTDGLAHFPVPPVLRHAFRSCVCLSSSRVSVGLRWLPPGTEDRAGQLPSGSGPCQHRSRPHPDHRSRSARRAPREPATAARVMDWGRRLDLGVVRTLALARLATPYGKRLLVEVVQLQPRPLVPSDHLVRDLRAGPIRDSSASPLGAPARPADHQLPGGASLRVRRASHGRHHQAALLPGLLLADGVRRDCRLHRSRTIKLPSS